MPLDHPGTGRGMGESDDRKKSVGERQNQAEDRLAEDGTVPADFARQVNPDRDDRGNRSAQSDLSEQGNRPYDDPGLQRPIAEADWPEDR